MTAILQASMCKNKLYLPSYRCRAGRLQYRHISGNKKYNYIEIIHVLLTY